MSAPELAAVYRLIQQVETQPGCPGSLKGWKPTLNQLPPPRAVVVAAIQDLEDYHASCSEELPGAQAAEAEQRALLEELSVLRDRTKTALQQANGLLHSSLSEADKPVQRAERKLKLAIERGLPQFPLHRQVAVSGRMYLELRPEGLADWWTTLRERLSQAWDYVGDRARRQQAAAWEDTWQGLESGLYRVQGRMMEEEAQVLRLLRLVPPLVPFQLGELPDLEEHQQVQVRELGEKVPGVFTLVVDSFRANLMTALSFGALFGLSTMMRGEFAFAGLLVALVVLLPLAASSAFTRRAEQMASIEVAHQKRATDLVRQWTDRLVAELFHEARHKLSQQVQEQRRAFRRWELAHGEPALRAASAQLDRLKAELAVQSGRIKQEKERTALQRQLLDALRALEAKL